MDSLVSAATICDVEIVPFDWLCIVNASEKFEEDWQAQGTNERSLDKSNGCV